LLHGKIWLGAWGEKRLRGGEKRKRKGKASENGEKKQVSNTIVRI